MTDAGSTRTRLRLSVQTKVLVPVLAVLTALTLVTVVVVDRHTTEQALREARHNLTTADAVFRNFLEIRIRDLRSRYAGAVEEPRYKAVASTFDTATYAAWLREALEEHGTNADVILLASADGRASAGARREATVRLDDFMTAAAPVTSAAAEGEAASDVITVRDQIYIVVACPVTPNGAVAAVLTVGLRLSEREAAELRSLTQTEVVIFGGERVAASTLHLPDPGPFLALARPPDGTVDPGLAVRTVDLDGEHFLALPRSLESTAGRGTAFRYMLLFSYEPRLRALAHTRLVLLGVSAFGIAISALLVWLLVHRITRPLRTLRDSAEAVGRGDFSRRIEQFPGDECGDLAVAFNRMTDSLHTSRAELERTVATLQNTQGQLVQRELRLRESEEGLRLIIEGARDHAIVTLDSEGRIMRWNAAAERLLGYAAGEAQGLAYANFFVAEDRSRNLPDDGLAAARRDGRHGFECRRLRKDGSWFWADVTLSALPAAGGSFGGFVEIARDVTLRKEAEKSLHDARDAAEAASRAKSEFLANMTHELRTPMNAIIGMSSLLVDRQDPAETRECAGTIRSSAHGLLDLIDDILDLSKIEAGMMEIARESIDLVGCVEQVVDHYAPQAAEKRLELGVHLAAGTPGIVTGDAPRLRQVLGCLLSNAVKFTASGGVTLGIRALATAGGPATVEFSVEDTGIGIPPEHLPRLFQPFTQGDASRTRRHGGAGLGLVLARRLVELMGGSIHVDSRPGHGSRFSFTIAAAPQPGPAEFGGLEGRRASVSSRSLLLRAMVQRQLAAWGIELVDAGAVADIRIVDAADGAPGAPPSGHLVVVQEFASPVTAGGISRALRPRALHAALRRAAPGPGARGVEAAFAQAHPLRVLVVEDNPVNARVVTMMLSRFGYQADHAGNGRLALERLGRQAYDLILMDMQMPELDGLDTTREIRRSVPASQPPYIVALTANARKEDRDACFSAGMHGFMAKPIQPTVLRSVLEQAHAWVARCAGRATALAG